MIASAQAAKRQVMPVRTRLKELRERRGESRMDLVRQLNFSYQLVTKWETKVLKQLDTHVLHTFLEHYGLRYEDLIYEVGEDGEGNDDRE